MIAKVMYQQNSFAFCFGNNHFFHSLINFLVIYANRLSSSRTYLIRSLCSSRYVSTMFEFHIFIDTDRVPERTDQGKDRNSQGSVTNPSRRESARSFVQLFQLMFSGNSAGEEYDRSDNEDQ